MLVITEKHTARDEPCGGFGHFICGLLTTKFRRIVFTDVIMFYILAYMVPFLASVHLCKI